MNRTTADVLHDHLAKREAGELEADLMRNYAPDVVLLSGFGVYHGIGGVRESAEKLFETLGPSEFEYDRTIVEGRFALLEWSARSESVEISDGADSFTIEDGRIVMQTVHYTARRTRGA